MELEALGIRNKAMSSDFRIMTTGQLDEEQLASMPKFGYDTVICLRDASEDGTGWEEAVASRNSVKFVRMPVSGKTGMTRETAEALDAAIPDSGCCVVCCGSSNRVGGLMALRAHFVDGKAPEEALRIGKDHGMTRTEAAVRKAMGMK